MLALTFMSTVPKPQLDILVTDAEGNPVLIAEVKRRRFDNGARQQVETYAKAVLPDFVMTVDPYEIVVAKTSHGSPQWKESIRFSTEKILRSYDRESDLNRVEGFYLESLIEAWLRDYSFGWKSSSPPGYEDFDQIGLASRLQNSETHTQR